MLDDVAEFPASRVVGETEKAIKVRIPGQGDKWIPKSALHDHSEVWSLKNAGPGKLVVAEWWAEKEGLT